MDGARVNPGFGERAGGCAPSLRPHDARPIGRSRGRRKGPKLHTQNITCVLSLFWPKPSPRGSNLGISESGVVGGWKERASAVLGVLSCLVY